MRQPTRKRATREALTLGEHIMLGELLAALSLTSHDLHESWRRQLHVNATIPERLQALVPQHWQRARSTNAYRSGDVGGLRWLWLGADGQLVEPDALLAACEDARELLQRCGLRGKQIDGAVVQLGCVRSLLRIEA